MFSNAFYLYVYVFISRMQQTLKATLGLHARNAFMSYVKKLASSPFAK